MNSDWSDFKIKNKQQTTARAAWFVAAVFAVLSVLPFYEDNLLSGIWAIAFVSFLLFLSAVVTALIFRSRAAKMKKLISGENRIAYWKLNREELRQYVEETSRTQKERSKALLWITGLFFLAFTILFLFFLEDDERIGFFLIMFSVFLLIFLAAKFFPWLYKYRNQRGDGHVLIGSKYIYINGYFHNWDFPMSGLKKLKPIESPFRGIFLSYYYTDRTGQHTFELKIPVPEMIDVEQLIFQIKNG